MDCSAQGFPIHHQLSEITQTHVHRLGDAIQPPHPLSTLSVFNLTQHQGIFFLSVSQFFTSGAQSLELKLQYFSHLMQRTDSLEKTLVLEKTEDKRSRGWQRMRWLDGIPHSMDILLLLPSRFSRV